MAASAKAVGVPIVTGDTKVVARGPPTRYSLRPPVSASFVRGFARPSAFGRPGDAVICERPPRRARRHHPCPARWTRHRRWLPERHGTPRGPCSVDALDAFPGIHSLRDPTRGGLAATLNEFADQAGVCIEVDEDRLPVSDAVESACELLGLDPLHLANEGVLVALVPEEGVSPVLAAMHQHAVGAIARVVGTVRSGSPSVVMRTRIRGASDGTDAERCAPAEVFVRPPGPTVAGWRARP